MIVILGAAGFAVIAAAMLAMARMPLRPGRLHVRRGPQGDSPVLSARLVPSHRGRAERLPAASTEGRVYVITDLPGAHQGARASREG